MRTPFNMTYYDEQVELLDHGFQCRAQEQPQYPDPWAYYGIFSFRLEVAV